LLDHRKPFSEGFSFLSKASTLLKEKNSTVDDREERKIQRKTISTQPGKSAPGLISPFIIFWRKDMQIDIAIAKTALTIMATLEEFPGEWALIDQHKEWSKGEAFWDELLTDIAPNINIAFLTARKAVGDESFKLTTEVIAYALDEINKSSKTLLVDHLKWHTALYKSIWRCKASQYLQSVYKVSPDDVDIDMSEMFERFGEQGKIDYISAIQGYADRYGLRSMN
jgi:hypothetical protein